MIKSKIAYMIGELKAEINSLQRVNGSDVIIFNTKMALIGEKEKTIEKLKNFLNNLVSI